MGIDLDIRTELRERWAPHAFTQAPQNHKNAVVIEDLLTRVFSMYGPSPGGKFTGVQLFEALFKPIREALWDQQVCVYVAICDDQRGVPAQKGITQALRNIKSTVKPYEGKCEFSADGLRIDDGPVRPFETQRLFRTRSVRPQVWEFMMKCMRMQSFPPNQAFVFDFDAELGPVVFQGVQKPTVLAELKHNLGEADLAVPFYVRLFPDHKVFIRSCDSDTLPVVLCGMDPGRPANSVVWEYEDKTRAAKKRKLCPGKQLVYVNLVQLMRDLHAHNFGIGLRDFVLLTMLCGNDFVFKKWCFSWFGMPAILQVVKQDGWLNDALETRDSRLIKKALELTVYSMLSGKINSNPDFVKASKSTPIKDHQYNREQLSQCKGYLKRHTIPSEYDLENCVQALAFNHHYWTKQVAPTQQQIDCWQNCLSIASPVQPNATNLSAGKCV